MICDEKRCNIATRWRARKSQVVFAINEKDGYYNYGSEVEFQIDREIADFSVEAPRAPNVAMQYVNLFYETLGM